MATKTFPKEISRKIINEFLGDVDEMIPAYPFKKMCDEAIESLLNVDFSDFEEETYLVDIIIMVRYLRGISKMTIESEITNIFINMFMFSCKTLKRIMLKLIIKIKLWSMEHDHKVFFHPGYSLKEINRLNHAN